jgi:hypothetical protein
MDSSMRLRTGLSLLCVFGFLACGDNPGTSGSDDEADAADSDSDGDTGTTGPSEPPWGEPFDPCEDVTCSGHGTCVATGMLANCECEDGFLARRHECITCTPLGEDHVYDIDVPMIVVNPEVTVAGAAPPPDGHGNIYLVSGQDTLRVVGFPNPPEPISLIPGTYDLWFYRNYNADEDEPLPQQNDVVFATNRSVMASGPLHVDLPVATVTTSLRVNGQVPDLNTHASWTAAAVDPVTGHAIEFEEVDDLLATRDLIAGVYDLRYRGGGYRLPDNIGAIVMDDAVIAKSGHIVLDVPMIDQVGTVTIAGQQYLGNGASIELFSPTLGEARIGISEYDEEEYFARLIPGTYDVRYRAQDEVVGLPDNENAIIPLGLNITIDEGTTDVDVPMVTRSGALTLDGVPVEADEWGAELYYVNRTTGDRVLINDLAWGEYSIEIIPGVYDLLYDLYEPRAVLPGNDEALIAPGLVIDESGVFDIDVPKITVSGSMTVDGQTVAEPEEAEILFAQRETGGRALAGDLALGTYSTHLIPGTYDIVYDTSYPYEVPVGLPVNRSATVLWQVPLHESGNFDIDVPTVQVTGNITINGEPVPGGAIDLVQVGGYDARLGFSAEPYSTLVVPGTYAVEYVHDSSPTPLSVPGNPRALLDCIVIE